MKFREWLPITRRNRVALVLAGLALVLFVVWNFLPQYRVVSVSSEWQRVGFVGEKLWSQIFNYRHYESFFLNPEINGFIGVTASLTMILNASATVLSVPFWKTIHASMMIRLPLAVSAMLGCIAICARMLMVGIDSPNPGFLPTLSVMLIGTLFLSASLLVFKNELALREERDRPKAH